jgi:hypothetical protein
MNAYFDGDQIVTFNDGGNCIGEQLEVAVMEPCSTGGNYTWWVVHQLRDGFDYIVNVGYSNLIRTSGGAYNNPYGLGTGCGGTGCTVSLDPVLSPGNDYVEWARP